MFTVLPTSPDKGVIEEMTTVVTVGGLVPTGGSTMVGGFTTGLGVAETGGVATCG